MLSRLSKPRSSQISSRRMADTYMVYPPADTAALTLIHNARPAYKWMTVYWNNPEHADTLIDKDGVKYPIEPEPSLIADNDLLLIGGWTPNPYVKKYFVDTGILKVDPNDNTKMIGPGVYANGKRCITSVQRPNGTIVTCVFGWDATDTFYATQDYLGGGNILLTLIPYGIAFVAGLVVSGGVLKLL